MSCASEHNRLYWLWWLRAVLANFLRDTGKFFSFSTLRAVSSAG